MHRFNKSTQIHQTKMRRSSTNNTAVLEFFCKRGQREDSLDCGEQAQRLCLCEGMDYLWLVTVCSYRWDWKLLVW